MNSDSPDHGNEKATTAHAPGFGTGDTYLGRLRESLVAKRTKRGLYQPIPDRLQEPRNQRPLRGQRGRCPTELIR